MCVRTSQRMVTFASPFLLSGVDGIQPPGTYRVETDEERIEGLSFPAYRRTATMIELCFRPGLTEMVTVDPLELHAAEERDCRRPPGQAGLDDLLADDVLRQVLRSAGLSPAVFRLQLQDVAARMRRAKRLGGEAP